MFVQPWRLEFVFYKLEHKGTVNFRKNSNTYIITIETPNVINIEIRRSQGSPEYFPENQCVSLPYKGLCHPSTSAFYYNLCNHLKIEDILAPMALYKEMSRSLWYSQKEDFTATFLHEKLL